MQVEPTIPGLRELLNNLNKTGNFTEFCKVVRQKFKEVLKEGSEVLCCDGAS